MCSACDIENGPPLDAYEQDRYPETAEEAVRMAQLHLTDDLPLPVDLTTRLLQLGVDVENLEPEAPNDEDENEYDVPFQVQ